MKNVRERRIANPYAKSNTSQIKIPKLDDSDLDNLADDPDAFFDSAKNRAKFFGMEANELKATLTDYSTRKGIDNAAMIKSVITEIDW